MMFYGNGMGGWAMVLITLSNLLFWGLVIAGVVLLVGIWVAAAEPHPKPATDPARTDLAERFALGQINEEEYQRRLQVLDAAGRAHPSPSDDRAGSPSGLRCHLALPDASQRMERRRRGADRHTVAEEAIVLTMEQGASDCLANRRIAVTSVPGAAGPRRQRCLPTLREHRYSIRYRTRIRSRSKAISATRTWHRSRRHRRSSDGHEARDRRPACTNASISESNSYGCPAAPALGAYPDSCRNGREHRITVIDGGNPCMLAPTADLGREVMRCVESDPQIPKRV